MFSPSAAVTLFRAVLILYPSFDYDDGVVYAMNFGQQISFSDFSFLVGLAFNQFIWFP